MLTTDEENLELINRNGSVDSLNREFYGRFPYPWPPMTFPSIADPQIERRMLNQSVGAWNFDIIPPAAKIWVAGCGTNQAIYTALKYPDASIVASDVSTSSLSVATKSAETLALKNITFTNESLNDVTYNAEFDYIICTGVVHHNAQPSVTLTALSRALRPTGILELMVYNRFHRMRTTNVQKAVRIISRALNCETDFETEFKVAKAIVTTGPLPLEVVSSYKDSSEAEFADSWLQPVEHSYTVESLIELANNCNLHLRLPCLNQFDYMSNRLSWDTSFGDKWLQAKYNKLPDRERWQITNLVLADRSPMLWFFLGKEEVDSHFEQKMCEEFLNHSFRRTATTLRNFVRQGDGRYKLSNVNTPYPLPPGSKLVSALVERTGSGKIMADILSSLGVDTNNHKTVNELRIQTTTPLCPYLTVQI